MNGVGISRFNDCLDIEYIKQRATVRPDPVGPLMDLDPTVAGVCLRDALMQIFIPNEFSVKFIKEMLGRAYIHSQKIFSSESEYAMRLYTPLERDVFPVCLTGLAGIGKSQTISALRRILPTPVGLTCDHFDGTQLLQSNWYASALGKSSGKQILIELVGEKSASWSRISFGDLLSTCQRKSIKEGVSLAVLDEIQHMSKGSGVAKATEILVTMTKIGVPMVFATNYSLIHKLSKLNSEDKQRLLAEPRVMLPDDPASDDWRDYIMECSRVSNGCLLYTDQVSMEVYRSTYGVKRLVVQLFKQAYIEARLAGRLSVNISDIRNAYSSSEYTMSAAEVEKLNELSINARRKGISLDLVCPFVLAPSVDRKLVEYSRAARGKKFKNEVIKSALTEGERRALERLDESAGPQPSIRRQSKGKPITKTTPAETKALFFNYIEPR